MTVLTISRIAGRTAVLGPGLRAVIWVHGCPLRCAGCVAPEDLPFAGGRRRRVDDLAGWLNGLPAEITGVTFSGGEPMAQAAALAELATLIRRKRDWSVMSYTGFTLRHLRRHGDAGQRALLAALDVLVDGPYLAARHADLRWRGSDNQRVHLLTGRHTLPSDDRSAGIEVHAGHDEVMWIGVPPVAGFRDRFEQALRDEGVRLGDPAEVSPDESREDR